MTEHCPICQAHTPFAAAKAGRGPIFSLCCESPVFPVFGHTGSELATVPLAQALAHVTTLFCSIVPACRVSSVPTWV